MTGDPTYDIAERADHVEVRGVTSRDIVAALELYARMRAAQAEHVADVRDDLVHTLMAKNVPLPPGHTGPGSAAGDAPRRAAGDSGTQPRDAARAAR